MTFKKFFIGIIKYTALTFSLMLVGALSTFVTLRLFTTGGEAVVPDLTGKDAMEAVRILSQNGLQLKILPQKRYDDRIPADRIVSQDPKPQSKIKQGRSVGVYLSLGPEKVIVPDLVGQTTRVANMTLQQRGLHPGKIIYVSSPLDEPDQIVAQFPLPGTELTGTRAVNFLVNSAGNSSRVYVMPDVIGKPISQVNDYFQSAGLRVAASHPVDYPGIAAGIIVKQTPPAGYKISKDTFIGLYYSK